MSFPFDHYWLASDGRVFSSTRRATVGADDGGYTAWCEAGGTATRWPADASGAQTGDALNDVLRPYGLSMAGSVRIAAGTALVHVLDKTTKVTSRDLAYVAGLTSAREDMASIIRIAAVDGRSVASWFDAALAI